MELIGKLKELQPLAVIIVTTGFSSIDVAIRAIRTGAYHYLTKPIQPEELIKVVESGLGHSQELDAQGENITENISSMPEIKSSELLLLRGFSPEQIRDFMATGVLISYSKAVPSRWMTSWAP
ncbi:MAG: response regulator [Candidatus Cloacimonetes bacterium]|nr:response regulator [Candidatus Cloacimonadota bacterium]